MKADLKRIEITLHQLTVRSPGNDLKPADWKNQTGCPLEEHHLHSHQGDGWHSFSMSTQSQAASNHQSKTPILPKLKAPRFSNHRHAANPTLAINLLQEIEVIVAGWHQKLQQVLRQIQDLYLEGPIVDGWLESDSGEPRVGVVALRHAEVDRLMDYVEEICNQPNAKVRNEFNHTTYRLCGLDENGQVLSQPCPPEQIPSVSIALARGSRLRQLLSYKEELETRLNQLAETLVVLHSHIQD